MTTLFDFGTERYPPDIARRLRVMNVTCWSSAPIWLAFAVFYAADPRLRIIVIIDVAMAAINLALPLLHRFGPRVAAIAFAATTYPATFFVCSLLGTDSGMQMHFLAYAAGSVLIVGVAPVAPAIISSAIAIAFIIALEVFAPNDAGLLSEEAMLGGFIVGVTASATIICAIVIYSIREAARAEAAAAYEYGRSEALLANVLPASVADRLKASPGSVIADRHAAASVLFADMEGFTAGVSNVPPDRLVAFLNEVFSTFDRLVERHGLEKIKTTGDSYMVVSGVPVPRPDHAAALLRLGMDMLEAASRMRDLQGRKVSIRVGIASGPVVAGVVGMRKFFYDVWGDTVNVASRMETTGVPGRIQVSPETYREVGPAFAFESRGPIEIKGKGPMMTWLLERDAKEVKSRASEKMRP